jgi:hypothetical protein
VDGLFGYYRCPACGDFFNLQLINLVRHTPRDAAAVAHWLTQALNPTNAHEDGEPDGVSTTGD